LRRARQCVFRADTDFQTGVEIEQNRAIALQQAINQRVGKQGDIGLVRAARVPPEHHPRAVGAVKHGVELG